MKIAFYAPMKPIDSPTPSGDRQMARSIIGVLEAGGHEVRVASKFRSWCSRGGDAAMKRLGTEADLEADRILRQWADEDWRPDIAVTYHVYHKAPDWLGPRISRALNVPYVIIEGARALKQKNGPWAVGFAAADSAFKAADLVVAIHAEDAEGLRPVVAGDRLRQLLPFIDTGRFKAVARKQTMSEPANLLVVGMMRDGDKFASYRVLADALALLANRHWHLTIAGDGPAADEIKSWFAAGRATFLGEVAPADMPAVYGSADIFVWPAVNEAYGLVLLEAQAAGMPVVAGNTGGVPDIVADGETGLLCPEGNAGAFAANLDRLLSDPRRAARMGAKASDRVRREHDAGKARLKLQAILDDAVAMHAARSGAGKC